MQQIKMQQYKNCVMDTTDKNIIFNEDGICNHCDEFINITSKNWFPNAEGFKKLNVIYKKMKEESKNREYDCILGLSGGVDSSYLALKLFENGIKPLVVDGGRNNDWL